jgi:hypothetical protein
MPRKTGKPMDIETPEETAERKREEDAAERARVERLSPARMEYDTPAEVRERELMNKNLTREDAIKKQVEGTKKIVGETSKAWEQARKEREDAEALMAIDPMRSRGGPAPANPLDMRGICSQVTSEDGWANIYLLRYQTPESLMRIYFTLIKKVYDSLNIKYFGGQAALIGLGYFYLRYDGKGGMSAEIFDTDSIGSAMTAFGGGKPTLTTTQFFEESRDNPQGFVKLVKAIIYKSFLELFIQSNLRRDVPFECRIALDLYASRSYGQSLLFHKDEIDSISTQFFTLTYIIDGPDIIIKGPTIVTEKDMGQKASITPAVRNGSTVGIDNRIMYHATPGPGVSILTESPLSWTQTPLRRQQETPQFVLKNVKVASDSDWTGPYADPEERRGRIEKLQSDTANTPRSFIRTWYITDFRNDRETRSVSIPELELSMSYIEELISDIETNTCFVNAHRVMSADEFIERNQGKLSLGGAETVNEPLLKPLQYDTPLAEKKGPSSFNKDTIAKESKPIISNIIGSAEFRELLTSTDNFILGTIVKDKSVALPMGGKQVARSKKGKKKTMKRVKRSSTQRRMVRRKQKTRIRARHTKTRR